MRNADFPVAEDEQQKCRNFITDFEEHGIRRYADLLQDIADRSMKIFRIELDDVLSCTRDDEFVMNIMNNAPRYVKHFTEVIDQLLPPPSNPFINPDVFDILQRQRSANLSVQGGDDQQTLDESAKNLVRRYEVSIIPPRSVKAKKLREIKAEEIGHLVKIKGMVTRSSDVKPMVTLCTYTCEICNSEILVQVQNAQFMPLDKCPSQRCKDNKSQGKLVLQTRGSRFEKYQELRVQELPDQVPVGHIPRAMTIHCRGEQTRRCVPGDIVTISGVFLTVRFSGFRAIKAGLQADTYVEAFDIEKQKLGYGDLSGSMDKEAEALVREIGRDMDPYGRLASSIAPEIFGHEDVKKALLLQLVGGATRVLPDGMKIRGDINILLMGDPGVAKSQLLKYVATVAPRGVYTTGKGSSGVGLTAAVVKDKQSGELSLEGGALVLADNGVCCIDEFDKMDENDRTAIHEVMEQQTISIAKAGITTTLNARAAVLAAANPLYGRYNVKKSISDNVDLPNSLLSRFDIMFLILDKADLEKDLALSKHVLHVHRYMKNPKQVNAPLPPAVFKQFIAAARTLVPTVPRDLTTYIVEAYVNLRLQDNSGGPVAAAGRSIRSGTDQAVMTARQLLSILRLSQALARLRLSYSISHEDVDEAIRLTHASKASLVEDNHASGMAAEDVLSSIFSIIRDYAGTRNVDVVSFNQIEAMVVRKGYTPQQLQSCLDEYSALGVIRIDSDRANIYIEG